MRRIKMMGLCLVAVFSMAIVAVSSASAAEPAFYECAKVAGGKFSNKTCSSPGTGKTAKYELKEGVGKGKVFKGKGGTATLHTPAVGGEVSCKAFKDEGKIATPTTQTKVVSIFTGCTSLSKPCTSPGAKKGEIRTKDLAGTLGYISKAGKEVGVELKPETGSVLAEFTCEELSIVTEGAVIGRQEGDINKFSKTSTNVFKVNGEGFQEVQNFEGGPKTVLESKINGAGPFESGQQATATNKGEELEIKA